MFHTKSQRVAWIDQTKKNQLAIIWRLIALYCCWLKRAVELFWMAVIHPSISSISSCKAKTVKMAKPGKTWLAAGARWQWQFEHDDSLIPRLRTIWNSESHPWEPQSDRVFILTLCRMGYDPSSVHLYQGKDIVLKKGLIGITYDTKHNNRQVIVKCQRTFKMSLVFCDTNPPAFTDAGHAHTSDSHNGHPTITYMWPWRRPRDRCDLQSVSQ